MSKETASYLFNDASDHSTNYEIDNIQWNYREDVKSKSYADNMTQFDFSDLANSTAYTAYNMWSLIFPWTMIVSNHKGNLAETDFALSLKSSILEAINTVRIDINDVTMNSPTQYTNMALDFNLTKMSKQELDTLASLINYKPDTVGSLRRALGANSAQACENYEYNNVIQGVPTFAGADLAGVKTELNSAFDFVASGFSKYSVVNNSRLARMSETSFNPSRAGITNYYTIGEAQNAQVSHVHADGVFHGYSVIPLGLIHPFFKTCPPLRGAKLKLYIQLNVNLKYDLTVGANGLYTAVAKTGYGNGSGMCPFQVSPVGSGVVNHANDDVISVQFLAGRVDATTTVGATGTPQENRVITANTSAVGAGISIRYPMITLNPDFENEYLKDSVKKCAFEDFVVYPTLSSLTKLDGGASATNIQITNSISRLRGILVLPQSMDGVNGADGPSYSSPFSSAPFTTAPYALPRNLMIQVNNRNVFAQPLNYTYEMYLENLQTSSIGKISELGLGSGIISRQDFERGMGYCYFDLKQSKYEEEDKLSVPVNISLTNSSRIPVKYVVILFHEKRYEVDCSKGSFVVTN
jgi:hypothetical protein